MIRKTGLVARAAVQWNFCLLLVPLCPTFLSCANEGGLLAAIRAATSELFSKVDIVRRGLKSYQPTCTLTYCIGTLKVLTIYNKSHAAKYENLPSHPFFVFPFCSPPPKCSLYHYMRAHSFVLVYIRVWNFFNPTKAFRIA